ncbi:MAG: hypothetical protein KKB25_03355 [Nanoarchaeota archaeon]|nr:hypothetical protein [bacterium]MBU3958088.1 hypothetical protein [Nanoarchaeota archaeon]
MLEDLIQFSRIMQEVQADYEDALKAHSSYLKEIMGSSLSPEIKKNILEYEEDKIEIIGKKHMLKKMRQLSDEFPPEMREEAEKTNRSVENYLGDMEKRWVFYGNPQGSDIGAEIRPRVSKKQIVDENYVITMQLLENIDEKI